MRNLEHEVHVDLKAYYEVAMESFVNSVTKLVVELFLEGPDWPVRFFSPLYVGNLTHAEVRIFVAEEYEMLTGPQALVESEIRRYLHAR